MITLAAVLGSFTRVGASDRTGDPVPGFVIIETPLFVLVLGEHKNVSPVAPVPRRLDHGSALARIAQAEALGIAGIKPPPLGPARPFPARPEDAHRERLHVARRDIDQQVPNLAMADGFQVLAKSIDVPAGHKRRDRLKYDPSLFDKLLQAARGQ